MCIYQKSNEYVLYYVYIIVFIKNRIIAYMHVLVNLHVVYMYKLGNTQQRRTNIQVNQRQPNNE